MTQTHTPGPWATVLVDPYDSLYTIENPDGLVICEASTANARLIAAAPELLEALEWAIQHAPTGAARDRVQRIISKARGEA